MAGINHGNGYGVYGSSAGTYPGIEAATTGSSYALLAYATNSDGVYGTSVSANGVVGEVTNTGAGVAGINHSSGPGIYGENQSGGLAGDFLGDVTILGTLTATIKHFVSPHR